MDTMNQEKADDILNLQMLLTNSSFGHEYARKEYEGARTFEKKERLLAKMEHYKRVYFEAREVLMEYFPDKLDDIEKDLLSQKQTALTEYNA
ncbi:MAG: hypothetical protein HYS22_09050 [Deltaproteobacteria bacterium]|nr:hypothetical protein [Deltaproteobacteria bacterium]